MLLGLVLFVVLISFVGAKLEINIEGKHGWAEGLPTWKVKNSLTRFLWGERAVTGYHLWFLAFNFMWSQLPFVLGLPWKLETELLIFAAFCIAIILEDFFWFVFNPHFGISKFNSKHANWHLGWVGFVPNLYIKLFAFSAILIFLSFFV